MGWVAADAEAKEQAKIAAVVEAATPPPQPKPPSLPPYIKQCVTYGIALQKQDKAKIAKPSASPKAPTADELILAELKTADERRACAKAVLEYYQSIQKQKAAAAKQTKS